MTLTFLLNQALRNIGVLPTGASLGAASSQLIEGQDVVNNMIDNWSSDSAMALMMPIGSYGLTAGNSSYSIGTGQTFNIARPVQIVAASTKLSNGINRLVKVCTAQQWAGSRNRSDQGYVVEELFYDRGFPNGKVLVAPTPLGTPSLELIAWIPLPQFPDATTNVTLYPAYARMLELATSMEMAGQYPNATRLDWVAAQLTDAKAVVRNLNASLLGESPAEGQTGPVAEK